MQRQFSLNADTAFLPRGTRAVTRVAVVDASGRQHRPGVHVVVDEEFAPAQYRVHTVAGVAFEIERHGLALERPDLLPALALRQHDHARLQEHVVLSVVVGSQAWGLADASSDEDIRGVFVLPFEEFSSIYDAPDEIHAGETAFWELEKFVRQGLRADPNTLETLWSPLVRHQHGVGERLRAQRELFTSRRVVDSFGRYAHTQLHKLARAATRRECLALVLDEVAAGRVHTEAQARAALPKDEDLHALVRSLFDRGLLSSSSFTALQAAVAEHGPQRLLPDEVRPKNAYNLVRLLHSCLHWLEHGTPLIVVQGPLRDTLLDIKHSRTTLANTLQQAHDVAAVIDERVRQPTCLPDDPDIAAADALVRAARRHTARQAFTMTTTATTSAPAASVLDDRFVVRTAPTPLPLDVDLPATHDFLVEQQRRLPGPMIVVGLTGAHAYGFPSPDSDLDLKAIHVVPARALLGLVPADAPLEHVEVWRGRELDLSSHALHQAAHLLLKGNGNMLERLLGPCVVWRSPTGEALTALAQRLLSQRAIHHYRGFFERMLVEHEQLKRTSSSTAKKMLYAYRVALTGTHLLATGALVTDVRPLAEQYGFSIEALLRSKQLGEKAAVTDDHDFLRDVERLRTLLEHAKDSSVLPPEPPADVVADLDAFVADTSLACPSVEAPPARTGG
jgi:predicted nucleotidyltransferase